MKTFIYQLKLDPRLYDNHAWTDEGKKAVECHYIRLKEDFEKGIIIHVGRTEDPTYDGFGIVVFNALSIEEAKAYMLDDPAVKGGQMTAKVFPYKQAFHQ
ncbi:MAG: hypothetical protein A2Y45_08095 [Tenericutes bacterium GWC2_34_14]|nr:MAG: hypothetical protein A2Z84_07090 [Tenericutes bacterium GWA2_35_7]OHE29858.1 MAG: hypothetical protein A2Y45_08095 [Tenericutes bacterium GWC2_34_14]OHE34837.1 MAG: hypothetical protein A2012_01705 [Tenericutes bacterium GWE2_34_108]OHE37302.1 MAG: hypothetical protein A2Y46_01305 [Tenericutes bacterium GWF1_35_14]OHE39565.1 MAG: hypothetical protein A2Y44_01555 [Tenericutes bacterium GWF2_35_184]OHE43167.1 MAG: hypothetical protein A3K26_03050 [Tenericutes bacterium RIFOXYA12_FULL_35_